MSTSDPMRPGYNTQHLGLPVPGDAGAADQHQVIRDLAERLDTLAATGFLRWEPGDLKVSATLAPPTGWLLCNGQAISRTVYGDLFAAIGTAYGAGNGSTTFNVPNLVDTMPLGASPSRPRGARGGVESVALTDIQSGVNRNGSTGWQSNDHSHHTAGGTGIDQPDHGHNIHHPFWINEEVMQGSMTVGAGTAVRIYALNGVTTAGRNAYHAHDIALWSGGVSANHNHVFNARNADEAHTNMPPFVAVNVFIKT